MRAREKWNMKKIFEYRRQGRKRWMCQQPAASDLEGGEGGWWDRQPSTLSTGFLSDLLTDPSGQ